jgi:hypothetical protein
VSSWYYMGKWVFGNSFASALECPPIRTSLELLLKSQAKQVVWHRWLFSFCLTGSFLLEFWCFSNHFIKACLPWRRHQKQCRLLYNYWLSQHAALHWNMLSNLSVLNKAELALLGCTEELVRAIWVPCYTMSACFFLKMENKIKNKVMKIKWLFK